MTAARDSQAHDDQPEATKRAKKKNQTAGKSKSEHRRTATATYDYSGQDLPT